MVEEDSRSGGSGCAAGDVSVDQNSEKFAVNEVNFEANQN